MPLRDLPDPRLARLPQAPLELVVWQLQFAEPADISRPTVGPKVAEAFEQAPGGGFQLQRFTAPTVAISFQGAPPGAPQPEQSELDGWSLRRGPVAVTVNRQSVSVETTIFEGWDDFRRLVWLAINALDDAGLLPSEQRLGLRYVDRITHPGVHRPADWSALLAPWLRGPLAHPQLAESVDAYAQQVDFDAGGGLRAALRQNAFADPRARGRQTVVLDFDVYRTGYRLPDPNEILQATDHMNDLAHRLFEAAITDTLYAAFGEET